MRRISLIVVIPMLLLFAPPAAFAAESMWHLANSVATKTNGGSKLDLIPEQSFVTGSYNPKKRQFWIRIHIRNCPAEPLASDPRFHADDTEIIAHKPESSLRHDCFHRAPNRKTQALEPQWLGWTVPGAIKNPIGYKQRQRWIKGILKDAQRRMQNSAGCQKRNKRTRKLQTVHRGCPPRPLAQHFEIRPNGVSKLVWGSCRHRAHYKQIVLSEPYSAPGAPPVPRASIIFPCKGKPIPQTLKPGYRPGSAATPMPAPTQPTPPAPPPPPPPQFGIWHHSAVDTAEDTTYPGCGGDLSTGGPAVTVDVPANGVVNVRFRVTGSKPVAGEWLGVCLYEDGVKKTDLVVYQVPAANTNYTFYGMGNNQSELAPPLTFNAPAGTHTYSLKYGHGGATGVPATFSNRLISVKVDPGA